MQGRFASVFGHIVGLIRSGETQAGSKMTSQIDRMMALLVLSVILAAGPTLAQDKQGAKEEVIKTNRTRSDAEIAATSADPAMEYVRDNLRATLYHEFAHALIDMLELPVLGQEEDAADVLSALMIHNRHPEAEAVRIARNSSLSFAYDAEELEASGIELEFWGEHGPARQRYYNIICIFYGANPQARGDFASDLGLPEGRADLCPGEYWLAAHSWTPFLDQLREVEKTNSIGYRQDINTDVGRSAGKSLRVMVDELNSDFALPGRLDVALKRCASEDRGYQAFYSSGVGGLNKITFCRDYVQGLYQTASDRQ